MENYSPIVTRRNTTRGWGDPVIPTNIEQKKSEQKVHITLFHFCNTQNQTKVIQGDVSQDSGYF